MSKLSGPQRRHALTKLFTSTAQSQLNKFVYAVALPHGGEYNNNLTVVAISLAGSQEEAEDDFAEYIADFAGFECAIIKVQLRYLATCGDDTVVITGRL